jgi:phage-related protein
MSMYALGNIEVEKDKRRFVLVCWLERGARVMHCWEKGSEKKSINNIFA